MENRQQDNLIVWWNGLDSHGYVIMSMHCAVVGTVEYCPNQFPLVECNFTQSNSYKATVVKCILKWLFCICGSLVSCTYYSVRMIALRRQNSCVRRINTFSLLTPVVIWTVDFSRELISTSAKCSDLLCAGSWIGWMRECQGETECACIISTHNTISSLLSLLSPFVWDLD